MNKLDFKGLASELLSRWNQFLPQWLPGGKMLGREYCCANILGGDGDSFRVNTETGAWAEFSGDLKGGDFISLYAAINNIKNGEAAKRLSNELSFNISNSNQVKPETIKKQTAISSPPQGVVVPKMIHPAHGEPSQYWSANALDGTPIFYEARYETSEGKQFCPWSWSSDLGKWVMKAYPAPRPLFGLDKLSKRPTSPVLIVEGSKCRDAAILLAGHVYVCVTWSGGAKAYSKTDWTPLHGRKILIWPDNDIPGVDAAHGIAGILGKNCPEIKILSVSDMDIGWDVADALQEGWNWEILLQWAKPRVKLFDPIESTPPAVFEPEPETIPSSVVIEPQDIVVNNVVTTTNGVINSQVNVNFNTNDSEETREAILRRQSDLGLAITKTGQAICNIDNALRVLENSPEFKGLVWFDIFQQKIFTKWLTNSTREWIDGDTLVLTAFFQRELGLSRLSDDMVYKAITIHAKNNQVNGPKDWMETLQWDGISRIEKYFPECFGSVDDIYTRAVSKNFWVGIIARIYQPGCKMDNMVVLEGNQGTFKSTALQLIGKEWFTEAHESVTNKDFFLILAGKLIVEIAELHAFSKAEVTRIKQVISCQNDRFRTPYDRSAQDHPRMSIFVGTTNESMYLRDETGGRRFWPIKCGRIDKNRITDTREQCFAEAVALYKAGATWYEMPLIETMREQEERRQYDEWENIIRAYLETFSRDTVHVAEIANECLKIESGRIDRQIQNRISAVLKNLNYRRTQHFDQEGNLIRYWKKYGSTFSLPSTNGHFETNLFQREESALE